MEAAPFETCPDCRDCQGGLAHCHSLLLIDIDGFAECTDPLCSEPAEVHLFLDVAVERAVAVDLIEPRSPVAAA